MDSLDPSPDSVAEIDRLVAASRNAPNDMAAMDAMWRALYALDRWLFLVRGELSDPKPWAGSFPQGPMVFAFTTAARAQDSSRPDWRASCSTTASRVPSPLSATSS